MQAFLINSFVQTLLLMLDNATVKRSVDSMLDVIEDAVADSETKTDDAIIIPLMQRIREALEIPDND